MLVIPSFLIYYTSNPSNLCFCPQLLHVTLTFVSSIPICYHVSLTVSLSFQLSHLVHVSLSTFVYIFSNSTNETQQTDTIVPPFGNGGLTSGGSTRPLFPGDYPGLSGFHSWC